MNQKLKYLLFLILSLVTGWFFGFIKLPYFKASYDYYLGIISSICFLALSILIYWIFNKKDIYPENSNFSFKRYLAPTMTSAAIIFGIFNFWKNSQLQNQLSKTESELSIAKEKNNIEDEKLKLGLLQNLANLYSQVKFTQHNQEELDEIVNRIVAESGTLKVHNLWNPEIMNYSSLSTSRGILLLDLCRMDMDSISFSKIKQNINFSGADLRHADLHDLNLSGINLNYSNLEGANLQRTNLNNAELRGANLSYANLNNSSLEWTNLVSSNLQWAQISEAYLQETRFDSADLSYSNLSKSKMKYVKFIGTKLINSIFYQAYIGYGFLNGADFTNANLTEANLSNIIISNTNLDKSNLNDIIINSNWIENLKKVNPELISNVLNKYQIITDSISIKDSIIYKLSSIIK